MKKLSGWALLGIFGLGLFLRLYQLGAKSFWLDEVYVAKMVQLPIPELIQAIRSAFCPPFFHLLLNLWTRIFPVSEFWLRLPAVLFDVVGLFGLFLLASYLWGKKAGLWAVFLAAVSPFLVDYAQQARMYSLLAMLMLFSGYFLVRWIFETKTKWLFFYFLFTLLGIYTHYFAFFLLLTQNLFFFGYLWRSRSSGESRRSWRRWVICQSSLFLSYLPWVQPVLRTLPQWDFGRGIAWVAPLYSLVIFLWGAILPIPAKFPIVFLGLVVFLAFWREFPPHLRGGPSQCIKPYLRSPRRWARLAYPLMVLIIPIMITFLISKYEKYLYWERLFIFSSSGLFLIIGSFLAKIRSRLFQLILVLTFGFLSALSLSQWYFNPATPHNRRDWRGIAAHIEEHEEPGDLILGNVNWNVAPFKYYYQGRSQVRGVWRSDFFQEEAVNFTQAGERPHRLWLILHPAWPSDSQNLAEEWAESLGYVQQYQATFPGGVRLKRYDL